MAAKGFVSYWIFPLLSALVWLGMLLGMLIHWLINTHQRHYPSMPPSQHIAYISDIGAEELKPLFIAGCACTTILFDISFAAERWLRHKGRLAPNVSTLEKVLMGASIFFAVVGTCGLVLLSIFDCVQYPKLHYIFLLLFIAGYVISAIFICWEYQRLGIKYREYRILRTSFWVKLAFIIIEVALAITFGACDYKHHKNVSAIFEWIVAFIFTFYILSFLIDLVPAVFTKTRNFRFQKPEARKMESPASVEEALHDRGYQMDPNPPNF